MNGLKVKNTKDKLSFSIDKNNFSEEIYIQLLQIARLEYLLRKAEFNKSVEEFGEELKSNWWKENRSDVLKRIGK
jgi:hypothetical protein